MTYNIYYYKKKKIIIIYYYKFIIYNVCKLLIKSLKCLLTIKQVRKNFNFILEMPTPHNS